ncbi:MAG: hypothetical protein NT080_05625 [Spirochaetes bacterium]|nr:hypothetical protein [Spirochaetota bacterium]
MSIKEFLSSFIRSPLGTGSAVAAVAVAVGAMAFGLPVAAAVAAAAGGWVVFLAAAFVAGAAPRAAVRERDRSFSAKAATSITESEARKKALAALRVADPGVAQAVQYVVMEAGEYLESCRRNDSHDPAGDLALAEAVEIVNLFLHELDDDSKERRFGATDSDPFADAKGRAAAALKDKALALKKARTGLDGGLSGNDRMSIDEELR